MHELKETEAHMVQTERLAAVGELAAGIAHEINNPINFSLNALQTLETYVEDLCNVAREVRAASRQEPRTKDTRDDADMNELVDALHELSAIAKEGMVRTGRLVGELRDFAAPHMSEQGAIDIRQCLDSALQLTRHAMQKAGITPAISIEKDVPSIWGDARALGQVFLNLAKNATEALEGRGGTLRVVARAQNDALEIIFHDDGPGIPSDVRERLFEPFFTTKAAGRGTGLGLSISRKVIQEHGGTIECQPSEKGSRFVIRLPIGSRDEE
jgi:two-component system NtrC family sensor kinase